MDRLQLAAGISTRVPAGQITQLHHRSLLVDACPKMPFVVQLSPLGKTHNTCYNMVADSKHHVALHPCIQHPIPTYCS